MIANMPLRPVRSVQAGESLASEAAEPGVIYRILFPCADPFIDSGYIIDGVPYEIGPAFTEGVPRAFCTGILVVSPPATDPCPATATERERPWRGLWALDPDGYPL